MNEVVISYRDQDSIRKDERRFTSPYPAHKVKKMAQILYMMGCDDFKFHPLREKA